MDNQTIRHQLNLHYGLCAFLLIFLAFLDCFTGAFIHFFTLQIKRDCVLINKTQPLLYLPKLTTATMAATFAVINLVAPNVSCIPTT